MSDPTEQHHPRSVRALPMCGVVVVALTSLNAMALTTAPGFLEVQSIEAQGMTRQALWTIGVGGLLAFGLVAAACGLIARGNRVRRSTERALQESETRFRQMADSMVNPAEMVSKFEVVTAETGPAPVVIRLSGRVLLAEDGTDNQQLLSHYLRRAGADVTLADNGRTAVEQVLAAAAAGQPFDVVFMDMQMPELDGYGATSALRKRGQTLPVVALTANAMSDDRAKCLHCGCTDFLSKPVTRAELMETAARYLRAVRDTGDGPLVSTAVDDQEVQQFMGAFIEHLPGQVGQLVRLAGAQDLSGLRGVLHQLKGTCGLYGFDQLTDFAGRAEGSIKAGEALDRVKREVDDLIALIRRVQGYDPAGELKPAPTA